MSLSSTVLQGFAFIAFPEKSKPVPSICSVLYSPVLTADGVSWVTLLLSGGSWFVHHLNFQTPALSYFPLHFHVALRKHLWEQTESSAWCWGWFLRLCCDPQVQKSCPLNPQLLLAVASRLSRWWRIDWVGESKLTLHLWTLKTGGLIIFVLHADALAICTDRHLCFSFKAGDAADSSRDPGRLTSLKAKPGWKLCPWFLCCTVKICGFCMLSSSSAFHNLFFVIMRICILLEEDSKALGGVWFWGQGWYHTWGVICTGDSDTHTGYHFGKTCRRSKHLFCIYLFLVL